LRLSYLPGSFETELTGRVVRQTEGGFAIQFVDLEEEHVALLERMLPLGSTR
jgi:hypothetical protein